MRTVKLPSGGEMLHGYQPDGKAFVPDRGRLGVWVALQAVMSGTLPDGIAVANWPQKPRAGNDGNG